MALPEAEFDSTEHRRVWREATSMTLYVAVVLLATLAALPAGHDDAAEPINGPVGVELIAILWGTTIGLALAHYFAFRVAARGFGGGRPSAHDLREATAEVTAASFVAALASLPVLVFSPDTEQWAVLFMLALIIGVVSYLVERSNERTRLASLVFGVVTLIVGLMVASVKYSLTSH